MKASLHGSEFGLVAHVVPAVMDRRALFVDNPRSHSAIEWLDLGSLDQKRYSRFAYVERSERHCLLGCVPRSCLRADVIGRGELEPSRPEERRVVPTVVVGVAAQDVERDPREERLGTCPSMRRTSR